MDLADRLIKEWEEGRKTAKTVEEKIKYNVWDNFFKDVLPVLKSMKERNWFWHRNQRCKYITIKIDMRDGGCLIMDKSGKRINPEDLSSQS